MVMRLICIGIVVLKWLPNKEMVESVYISPSCCIALCGKPKPSIRHSMRVWFFETTIKYFPGSMIVYLCARDLIFWTMILLGICHGYFCIVHMHVSGRSIVLSQKVVCLWNDVCREQCISCAISLGFISILPRGS